MKRHWLITMGVLILAVGWFAFRAFEPKEPSYQGQTLSQCLNRFFDTNWSSTKAYEMSKASARQALDGMGTNLIPTLLEWLPMTNQSLGDRINKVLAKQHVVGFRFNRHHTKQNLALLGFGLLGKDGKPAVPTLIQLLYTTNRPSHFVIFQCLGDIDGHERLLLPLYLQLLQDQDQSIRLTAARYLAEQYPEEAKKAGVFDMKAFRQAYPDLKFPSATDSNQTHVSATK